MSNTPLKKTPPAAAPEIPSTAIEHIRAGQVATTQAQEAVAALARQLNYQGDLTPGVLENSARDAIRRIGAGIFELGGYLLLLKQACTHGEFLPTLERLGLGVSSAGRYMAITRRFANSAVPRNLEGVGVTKLVELLPLDDEQIGDLTELGQTGELAMDDVALMSVKELRQAVRGLRGDAAATARLLNKKNQRIDQLEREKVRIAAAPPDERLAQDLQALAVRAAETIAAVRAGLRSAFTKLLDREMEGPDAPSTRHVMSGYLDELEREIAILRNDFHLNAIHNA